MSITRHVYEIYIKATPDQVWQAIVDPEFTKQYFFDTAIESAFAVGEGYRYVLSDGTPVAEGVIEEIEPGKRLAMTFRLLYDTALADEPPGKVEWIVVPAGEATRLTVRHGDLFKSPHTWEHVRMGWLPILHGLKSLLETGSGLGTIDDPEATTFSEDPEGDWHRSQAVTANNSIWDFLGKPDDERTGDDDEQMTASAYTALYHWGRATGTGPVNAARGLYMIAKVWVARRNGQLALHYADLTMATCRTNDLADFDLAYAHEARARALALLGDVEEARAERAAAAAVLVAGQEDREIVEGDLAAEPWFGI
ncbi:MAG: SRPBCC family protein [Ilumatobacteraceae bacterium]